MLLLMPIEKKKKKGFHCPPSSPHLLGNYGHPLIAFPVQYFYMHIFFQCILQSLIQFFVYPLF